jgi:hypothetical protein
MRPTLLESHRSLLQSAECACGSLLAHLGVILLALGLTEGGTQLPADEREARVFFLLPPDRVDVRPRQLEIFRWGKLGGDFEDGKNLIDPSDGRRIQPQTYGARRAGERSGARGELPFGPQVAFVPDTVFSVLQVEKTVERHDGSGAPVYPSDLLAIGAEGVVEATYVVDTTGQVDTTTVVVTFSDDPRFTQSVRNALVLMRFRPAQRAGHSVRQLVEQRFRFLIMPPQQASKQVS